MTSDSQASMDRLLEIMARLRGPDGCPWDREQTLDTLKPYLIEESYEVLEALDRGDMAALREELGDLLLQIVFQSQLCQEEGLFTFSDVAESISDKLVRRHPHIFGDVSVEDSAEVLKNWDAIKKLEKGGEPKSIIDGIPHALPALLKAREVQKRVARSGFDWKDRAPVQEKVEEEWAELTQAIEGGDPQHIQDELGDVLFSLVNLSRFLDCDAEEVLRLNVDKFSQRFRTLESLAAVQGKPVAECSAEDLDAFWNEVKARESAE